MARNATVLASSVFSGSYYFHCLKDQKHLSAKIMMKILILMRDVPIEGKCINFYFVVCV